MPSSIFELTSDVSVRNVSAEERPFLAASNADTTLTAAQAVGGVVTMTPASSDKTITPPTAADLKTFFGGQLEIGTAFELTIVNVAAATRALTLASGVSGITLGGAAAMATIAAATSATYLFVCTAVGTPAFTVVRKGG